MFAYNIGGNFESRPICDPGWQVGHIFISFFFLEPMAYHEFFVMNSDVFRAC